MKSKNMKSVIILNLEWIKSTQYGYIPRCSGKRSIDNENYFEMKRGIGGRGFDKKDTAKSDVLNELLTQEDLESVKTECGVIKTNSKGYIIDGGCGTVDNIMQALGYQLFSCAGVNGESISYIKE